MKRQTTDRRIRRARLAAIAVSLLLTAGGCVVGPAATPSATNPQPPAATPTTIASPSATIADSDAPPTATTPAAHSAGPVTPTATAQAATPAVTARPTPAVTARPTPPPTEKPTPKPTVAAASKVVSNGPRGGNDVALTFDMGGRVDDAVAIMDYLVDRRIHASVFITGSMADNPWHDDGRQVLRIVDSRPDLFTLGNHSYSHPDFRDISATEIERELRRTEAAVGKHCSQDMKPFFRPPSGAYDAAALVAVGAAGYPYTVMWDVDTIDWRPVKYDPPGPTADEIVAKVLNNARGGSIVLMHLGGYHTYEALPRIVDGLAARGYDFVTLDEMFPN